MRVMPVPSSENRICFFEPFAYGTYFPYVIRPNLLSVRHFELSSILLVWLGNSNTNWKCFQQNRVALKLGPAACRGRGGTCLLLNPAGVNRVSSAVARHEA